MSQRCTGTKGVCAVQLSPHTPDPDQRTVSASDPVVSTATLLTALRRTLQIVHTPMRDAVARLDTRGSEPVLYLDPDSPSEDLRWAMLDVLRVLDRGPAAARSAIPTPNLRLVHGAEPTARTREQQSGCR